MDRPTITVHPQAAGRARKFFFLLLALGMAFMIFIVLFDKIFMPTAVRHDDDRLVPSIVGFTVDSAGVILKEVDLGVAVVGEEFSTSHPVGVIISQLPPPGMRVREGRLIKVSVSKGNPRLVVPNVVGMGRRQAELLLLDYGLYVGETVEVDTAGVEKGTVLSSFPLPGAGVAPQSRVTLTVAAGGVEPDSTWVPNVVGRSLEEAKKRIAASGLQLKDLDYEDNELVLPGTVLKQEPPGGMAVRRGEKVKLWVARSE
ncbi:MAG: PASTA domain-containing protein [candidate division Zixibacteria bacterium]|nr:PASTA domain-containing protein [candidate division Zixibacteria bacterium]